MIHFIPRSVSPISSYFDLSIDHLSYQLEATPQNRIQSFCHTSASHLKICSQSKDYTTLAIVLAFQLNTWLRSLDHEFSTLIPLNRYENFDISQVNDALLDNSFRTWYQWVAMIIEECLLVAPSDLSEKLLYYRAEAQSAYNDINVRDTIDLKAIWTLFLDFDDIYQEILDIFITWFNACSLLEIQMLTFPDLFDETRIEELFSNGHLSRQSQAVIKELEEQCHAWYIPYKNRSANLMEKVQHWGHYMQFPLRLIEQPSDVDILGLDHPQTGQILYHIMHEDTNQNKLDLTRQCCEYEIARTICIRGSDLFQFDILKAMTEYEAKKVLAPYTDVIHKMRWFEETPSVRIIDRQLRHLFTDFSGFFPDTEWPVILKHWVNDGDTITPTTQSGQAFNIFMNRLNTYWTLFCQVCEREWKRWRAKLTYLVYLTQSFQRSHLGVKKLDLLDVNICFDRALFYTGVCIMGVIGKYLWDDITLYKHDGLHSNYIDVSKRLTRQLGSDVVEKLRRAFKKERPYIYEEFVAVPIPATQNFDRTVNPRAWMARSHTTTHVPRETHQQRPPLIRGARSTNQVDRIHGLDLDVL